MNCKSLRRLDSTTAVKPLSTILPVLSGSESPPRIIETHETDCKMLGAYSSTTIRCLYLAIHQNSHIAASK